MARRTFAVTRLSATSFAAPSAQAVADPAFDAFRLSAQLLQRVTRENPSKEILP